MAESFANRLLGKIMGRDNSIFQLKDEYTRYAIEAQSSGQPALSFEEFARARKARPNPLLTPSQPEEERTPGYSFGGKR